MKNSKRRILVFIGLITLASAKLALASEDEKIYPGAMCQPYSSDTRVTRTYNGSVFNSSLTAQNFICPVTRDDVGDGDDPEFARINVSIGVNCYFASTSRFGTVTSYTGSSTVGSTLDFAPSTANLYNYHTDGIYHFICTVPANGYISSYRVAENVGED
ncbi:MAG: hypothetical protein ABL933_13460 [Methyloglobulus sp.]